MIKKLIVIIFTLNNVYAQADDSLFWFNMGKLNNNPPEFPLIIR